MQQLVLIVENTAAKFPVGSRKSFFILLRQKYENISTSGIYIEILYALHI